MIKPIEQLPEARYKPGKGQGGDYGNPTKDIWEFLQSGSKYGEIDTEGYSSPDTARNTYHLAAKRVGGVKIRKIGTRIFAVRVDDSVSI